MVPQVKDKVNRKAARLVCFSRFFFSTQKQIDGLLEAHRYRLSAVEGNKMSHVFNCSQCTEDFKQMVHYYFFLLDVCSFFLIIIGRSACVVYPLCPRCFCAVQICRC